MSVARAEEQMPSTIHDNKERGIRLGRLGWEARIDRQGWQQMMDQHKCTAA